jgi:hypothetical protein
MLRNISLTVEIDCPEGETPVEWMLLTTEIIADIQIPNIL